MNVAQNTDDSKSSFKSLISALGGIEVDTNSAECSVCERTQNEYKFRENAIKHLEFLYEKIIARMSDIAVQ